MERAEFDKMVDTLVDTRSVPVTHKYAGPSIIELIQEEIDQSNGDYRVGLQRGLDTINNANRQGKKPFYALKTEWAQACSEGNSEIVRGIKTVQFIFTTPYKWIAGEKVV